MSRLPPKRTPILISLTFLLVTPLLCDGTLSKSNPKKPKKDSAASSSHSSSSSSTTQEISSVFDRDLVKEKFKIQDHLTHHDSYCKPCAKKRSFTSGAALAYVTPWNNRGYDVAKELARKFTHVSPVWLQLKFVKNLHLEVTGTHDVDADWIRTLKKKNKSLKVVPRLLLDGWSGRDYARVFASEDAMASVANSIVRFLETSENDSLFDGVVFETSWLSPDQREDLLHLLIHVGDRVRGAGKEFLLVVPPASPAEGATTTSGGGASSSSSPFGAEEFRVLRDSVDYFSLMTYDYPLRPGPNAPIDWVRRCVEAIVPEDEQEEDLARRRQLLVGLNFYGYKYGSHGGDAILGSQLIEKLSGDEKYRVSWNKHAMEHKFSCKGEEIYFPTLYSIHKRLEMLKQLKTGLSIWEIGQGLNYFYDLL